MTFVRLPAVTDSYKETIRATYNNRVFTMRVTVAMYQVLNLI